MIKQNSSVSRRDIKLYRKISFLCYVKKAFAILLFIEVQYTVNSPCSSWIFVCLKTHRSICQVYFRSKPGIFVSTIIMQTKTWLQFYFHNKALWVLYLTYIRTIGTHILVVYWKCLTEDLQTLKTEKLVDQNRYHAPLTILSINHTVVKNYSINILFTMCVRCFQCLCKKYKEHWLGLGFSEWIVKVG